MYALESSRKLVHCGFGGDAKDMDGENINNFIEHEFRCGKRLPPSWRKQRHGSLTMKISYAHTLRTLWLSQLVRWASIIARFCQYFAVIVDFGANLSIFSWYQLSSASRNNSFHRPHRSQRWSAEPTASQHCQFMSRHWTVQLLVHETTYTRNYWMTLPEKGILQNYSWVERC